MAEQNIGKNALIPDLALLLKEVKTDLLSNINCIEVGTIQSFDSAKQTAKIQINIKRIKNLSTGEVISYPVLADCPVYFPGGQKYYLSFPVKQGDECIILFNDRDIDNWFDSGSESIPNTTRMHNLSDAFALVGIRSTPKVINPFDPTAVKLANDLVFLKLKENKIGISNAAGDYFTIFNSLIDALISSGVLPAPTIIALNLVKTNFALLFQLGSV